jgi:diguanylate cyclase (GGDEF)-like protein
MQAAPEQMADVLRAAEAALAAGDPVQAAERAERAAALARSLGDRRHAARADGVLALASWRQGRGERAVQVGTQALADTDAFGPVVWGIELRNTLTMACSELGLAAEALPHALEALRRARELDSAVLRSWCLNRLATVHDTLGDSERSIALLEEAAEQADAAGDAEARFAARINLASTFSRLAGRCRDESDREGQLRASERSLAAVRQASGLAGTHPHRLMFCYGIECHALELAGDPKAMFAAVERHQQLATQMQLPHFVTMGAMLLARALLADGRAEEACRVLETQVDESTIEGADVAMVSLFEARHMVYKGSGRFEQALKAIEQLRANEKREARQRIRVQSRALLRDAEVESARHETARMRGHAAEAERRAAAANHAAMQDALTGLANRRALDASLQTRLLPWAEGRAAAAPFCAAMIDIDHFKQINDSHGHEAGDQVLRELARLLTAATRTQDFVARNGGEEFVVLIGEPSVSAAADVCERLRQRVQEHGWKAALGAPEGALAQGVTISIGLTLVQRDDDVSSLLRRADMAMYRAKHGGRNRLVVG